MTPLRFRAWHKSKKTMHPVTALYFFEGHDFLQLSVDSDEGEQQLEQAADYIVMQSTGLTDRNGKEIFEGDVVRWQCDGEPPEGIFRVVWEDAHWILVDGKASPWYLGGRKHLTVIGNVYESPDLLPPAP